MMKRWGGEMVRCESGRPGHADQGQGFGTNQKAFLHTETLQRAVRLHGR